MRKPSPDSKLLSLPEATQQAIYRLETAEALTLDDIQARLAMPEDEGGFGLGHVSVGTVSNFLRHRRTIAFDERLRSAALTANAVDEAVSESDSKAIDGAILNGLREWILDSILKRDIDAKDAKALVGLVLKGRDQSLDERKLALLEKKEAALLEVKSAVREKGGLTAETLEEIEQRIGLL